MRASALAVLPLLALTACGTSSTTSNSSGGSASNISVVSGNTSCEVARTSLPAGKVTFDVRNSGDDVTEVYVYGKGSDGEFNKVVGEVENIAPGTSRDFPVTVSSGEYQVACKPGQKGDGIRTTLTVAGGTTSTESTESAAASAYDREVEVSAKDFSFTGLAGFTAKVGEKIEFKLANDGATAHELELFDPAGKEIGEVGSTQPGKEGEVIVTLATAGTYRFVCGISDHADRGMTGTFVVS